MRLSKQLVDRLSAAMKDHGLSKMDLSKKANISHTTVGRWLSGNAQTITETSAQKVGRVLGVKLQDMWTLSMGGMPAPVILPHLPGGEMRGVAGVVMESPAEYKTRDKFDRLAEWLRTEACNKTQTAIFTTAELGGFIDQPAANAPAALDCAG